MKVGVLALQGASREHAEALEALGPTHHGVVEHEPVGDVAVGVHECLGQSVPRRFGAERAEVIVGDLRRHASEVALLLCIVYYAWTWPAGGRGTTS